MKKLIVFLMVAGMVIVGGGMAQADTFLPGSSSVNFSVNQDGFFVNSTGFQNFGATNWAIADAILGSTPIFELQAGADSGQSEAGLVLYFNGLLKLGQLQSVSITTLAGSNATPIVNLWLDTGGDGNFFLFSGESLTGLGGDSYYGATPPGNINGGTTFLIILVGSVVVHTPSRAYRRGISPALMPTRLWRFGLASPRLDLILLIPISP